MLIIRNGTVFTGDGKTALEPGTVYVEGERVLEVREGHGPPGGEGDTEVDAQGCAVFPGLVNVHAHVVTVGPRFPTAVAPVSLEEALKNLDKHLSFGTTAVVNLDGFALPEEVEATDRAHPVRVFPATTHLPSLFQAALSLDGGGLTARHRQTTAEAMLRAGAVLIGEVGGGHVLGGGGQDYMYIPRAVQEHTGVWLEPRQARALKWAVLGRHIRKEHYRREAVQQVLEEIGLGGKLSPEEARDIVHRCVLPPFELALKGFEEAVALSRREGVPSLVHNSAPSAEAALEAGRQLGPLLIAGHTNHGTFTVEEAVESARALRRAGAVVEICTLDAFGAHRLEPSPDTIYALLEGGLVDILATDFAGGFWDCQLVGIEQAWRAGKAPLPALIGMASANAARAVPRLGDIGELAPGKLADIVIAPLQALASVRQVFVGGREVFSQGQVVRNTGQG